MYNLEYALNGICTVEQYDTIDAAEARAIELGLTRGDALCNGTYRITK
jgi:hypothetical protein